MRFVRFERLLAIVTLALAATWAGRADAQSMAVIFDDFNTGEGHFDVSPGFSGSSNGFQKTAAEYPDPDPPAEERPNPSTAEHDTTMSADTFGSGGSQRLDIYDDLFPLTHPGPEEPLTPNGGTARVRHVSGRGTTTNNISFTTGPEEDGWIGVAVKTFDPGWTVSIWIEVAPNTPVPEYNNNEGQPKEVIPDGQWHVYQWNLDDFTGGPDGWRSVQGIINGSEIVADDAHTIDSIFFRQSDFSQIPIVDGVRKSTIWMDYVVKTASGMITLPEQPMNDADFDDDGDVDNTDYGIWTTSFGAAATSTTGDANGDNLANGDDFLVWQQQYTGPMTSAGAVPEPAAGALAVLALAALGTARRHRS